MTDLARVICNYPAHPETEDTLKSGLSVRDYFTAAALTGLLANPECSNDHRYLAVEAVGMAEAVIQELADRHLH